MQENALENVVCEMASILSRPQCVKQIENLRGILAPILNRTGLNSGCFLEDIEDMDITISHSW